MKIFVYNSSRVGFFFFFFSSRVSFDREKRKVRFYSMDKATIRDNEMKWKKEWKRIK